MAPYEFSLFPIPFALKNPRSHQRPREAPKLIECGDVSPFVKNVVAVVFNHTEDFAVEHEG